MKYPRPSRTRCTGGAGVCRTVRQSAPTGTKGPAEAGRDAADCWRTSTMVRLVLLAGAVLVAAWSAPVAAQQAGSVDIKEWAVEYGGRTRDPAVAPDGKVWFVGQAGNYIAWFDPRTEQFKRFEIEEGTNPHSINVESNGVV